MKYIPGPDFPTGGIIYGINPIRGGTPGMLVNGVPAEKITPAPGTTLEIVIHTP